ncbi:DUF6387 family protein [Burkholderia orbicola]|uniref:DUF6387 family protein n=1 Tax=Burkholderia cenocepacia TaxID=95486 RepID=UPI0020131B79|nr:DUF6387 family protein [Burkholderia cenocepacia]
MRPRNNSRAVVPRNFQLGRYAATDSFDIVDWVLNLEARFFLLCLSSSEKDHSKGTENFVNSLLDDPVVKPAAASISGPPQDFSAVMDFDISDYFWGGVQDDRFASYKEAFDRSLDAGKITDIDRELLSKPMWMMFAECDLGYEENVVVRINLHSSEEKIVRDFTNWLRRTREHLSISAPRRPVQRRDFEEWSRFKVLPFLDLWLWSRVHGIRIPHQEIGVALFPDELDVNVAERIRKVVVPLAQKICAESFTDALRVQAENEIAQGGAANTLSGKFANFKFGKNGWELVRR